MNELPSNRSLAKGVEADAKRDGVTSRRLRRWIAVTAFIEILHIGVKDGIIPSFHVKGGFALEFRFRGRARASRDIDVVVALSSSKILDAVIGAMKQQWSGFRFAFKELPELREFSYKGEVNALYQGSPWSTFELELVFGDRANAEIVDPLDLTTYHLLQATGVPCISIAEQIAQKLHALTDPDENRPRDMVDIYVCLHEGSGFEPSELRKICEQTFATRAKHVWPPALAMRERWETELTAIIEGAGLDISPSSCFVEVQGLIDVLSRES